MATDTVLTLPIDDATVFQASQILYIIPNRGLKKKTTVCDLTTELRSTNHNGFNPDTIVAAKQLVCSASPPRQALTLNSAHWYSTARVTALSPNGELLAQWYSPIKNFGTSNIMFPTESPYCTHGLEVKPISVYRRSQSFVKDSATYAWMTDGVLRSGKMSLFKATGGKKIEIARYESESGGFTAGGLLALNEREVNEVVAIMTLMAVLNQRDAFYMPGLRLGKRI